jgi:hypothetical protein
MDKSLGSTDLELSHEFYSAKLGSAIPTPLYLRSCRLLSSFCSCW